jgi:hypothetical protein
MFLEWNQPERLSQRLGLALRLALKTSSQWQVQGQGRILASRKAVAFVKRLGLVVLGVHQQRVGTHKSAGLQAPIHCTAHQNLA